MKRELACGRGTGRPACPVKVAVQRPTSLRQRHTTMAVARALGPPSSAWPRQGSAQQRQQALTAPTPLAPSVDVVPWLQESWDGLAARKKLLIASHLGFVLSNMDKINLTIAIIPMSAHFGWTPSVSGLVQSAFFYGCVLMQLPGGALTQRLGGWKTLPGGVAVWSAATFCMPLLASTVPSLCLTRAVVGLGEAVAPTAIVDMIARTVPAHERASATSMAFAGLHMGSIVGLLVSPMIIEAWGWEPLFYTFGGAGVVWYTWFNRLVEGIAERDPEAVRMLSGRVRSPGEVCAAAAASDAGVAHLLRASSSGAGAVDAASSSGVAEAVPVPYRALLRSRPVQALMFTHFCNNWFSYTFLAWLPTYFTDTLSVDLMHAAQTALLPPLAGVLASAVAGPAADGLIQRGVPVAAVRKAAQGIAFLAPMACLVAVSCCPAVSDSTPLTVAAITAALGLSSFSLAGLYCTHQDLSPKYASSLLSLTNTAGALPGVVGVASVGLIFDATRSWELSLFLPSAALLGAGAVVYTLWGRHDAVDYDAEDDSPLGVEVWAAGVAAAARRWRDGVAAHVASLAPGRSDA